MRDRNWLDELRIELERKHLPPTYVERLVNELSDHVNDLKEAQMSKDALETQLVSERMGSAQEVAGAAAAEFRRANFFRRHPLLAFVTMPILVMPVLWLLGLTGVAFVGAAMNSWDVATLWPGHLPPAGVALLRVSCIGATLLPAIAAAAFFARLGARQRLATRWPLIACAIVGVVSGVADVGFLMTPRADNNAWEIIAFGYVGGRGLILQVVKLVVPLAIGAWMLRGRGERREEPAF